MFSAKQLNLLFQSACALDVCALKPGNVGLHGGGHDMYARDFMRSSAACGKVLCQKDLSLGERILGAIEATHAAVPHNTNLGIVLLCAPVIQAVLNDIPGDNLQQRIAYVLAHTDIEDARDTFAAIRLAKPGGMGKVSRADISEIPKVNLATAMGFAKDKDMIALQYVTDYALIFHKIIPLFLELHSYYGYNCWAITGTYLMVLGSYPDSLIARKYGIAVSEKISKRINSLLKELNVQCRGFQQFEQILLDLDRNLKQENINPGTTADLVVASVFITSLEGVLRDTFK